MPAANIPKIELLDTFDEFRQAFNLSLDELVITQNTANDALPRAELDDGTLVLDVASVNADTYTGVSATITSITATQTLDATANFKVPVGNTAARPASPVDGNIRYNTETSQYEGYSDAAWSSIGGGAQGSQGNQVFFENDVSVTSDYIITTGKNAMSAGPVTVEDGVVVTIPEGSVWSIV